MTYQLALAFAFLATLISGSFTVLALGHSVPSTRTERAGRLGLLLMAYGCLMVAGYIASEIFTR